MLSALALGCSRRFYLGRPQDQECELVSSRGSWAWRSLSDMHSIAFHFLLTLRTPLDICVGLRYFFCLQGWSVGWGLVCGVGSFYKVQAQKRKSRCLLVKSSTSYFIHVLESLTYSTLHSLGSVNCKILFAFVVFHQHVLLKLSFSQHSILGIPHHGPIPIPALC